MSEPGVAALVEVLDSLVGLAPWRVRLGHGNFVTADFGRVVVPPGESGERGEWHLWIYGAAWRIDSARDVVAGSEDTREVMSAAVGGLEGERLLGVRLRTPSLGLDLDFGGVVLRVFPVTTRVEDHWMLFTPSGEVFVAGPGSRWRSGDASRIG
ncbi:hypothetical protein [Saccharothrix variisporea]|uniref:Uncharacterized protein n=1 Tax=Saccharothrix variisporea TaxID=543527 RepID=A0A495X6Z7_9PSEU|nr:hypothetical protein [Saccharothrix variisporea]RKT69319.1 hypothetical protein DFJ66_2529 [Saccharothrix variisporea]